MLKILTRPYEELSPGNYDVSLQLRSADTDAIWGETHFTVIVEAVSPLPLTTPASITLTPGQATTISTSFGPVDLNGRVWLIPDPNHPYVWSPNSSIVELSSESDHHLDIELQAWDDAQLGGPYAVPIYVVSMLHGVVAEGVVSVIIADDGP